MAFSRGIRAAPDFDGFQHGIKKCRKTISNSVGGRGLFTFPRSGAFFNSLQRELDLNPQFLEIFLDPEGNTTLDIKPERRLGLGASIAKVTWQARITHQFPF